MQQLTELYDFFDNLAETRRTIVGEILKNPGSDRHADSLTAALATIDSLPGDGLEKQMAAGDLPVTATLDYEYAEIEKDIAFLAQAPRTSDAFLQQYNESFTDEVRRAVEFLGGRRYQAWISDRDGTINNYCGRYRSSHQSIYNAVFLMPFIENCTGQSVILTSAPLEAVGILDLSILPAGSVHYAGSKGREYAAISGNRGQMPIPPDQAELLKTLNHRIGALLEEEEHTVFGLIGSGVQYKFGQTTVSRQDIHDSVPNDRSRAFLQRINEIVEDVDPDGTVFQIEDTGLDIEIMLTVDGRRDFDKGDGLRFLNESLDLRIDVGPTLICGDTSSDVSMVEAAVEAGAPTWTIFVTTDDSLRSRVESTGAKACFVGSPDILVAALRRTGVESQ